MSSTITDTPCASVPDIVDSVATKKEEWKALPVSHKISILRTIIQNAERYHDEWMVLARHARGIDITNEFHGCGVMDVEITGPVQLGSYAHGLVKMLQTVERNGGTPPPPRQTRLIGKDHCAVSVYPDGSLLNFTETVGLIGELILSGTRPEQAHYEDYAIGGVAGILGAGNYDAPVDLLTQVFIKGRVCVYKPNPVSQASNPVLQKILEPLITPGYVKYVVGGADVGTELVQSKAIDEIILTGSPATLAKIEPLAEAPILSELGAVNPWIIVPGKRWNKGNVESYARALAWAKLINNGHVCASPQVVLLAKDWEWRTLFMDRLQHWLSTYAGSPPFYPGSDQSHAHFASLPNARVMTLKNPAFEKQQACVFLPNVGVGDIALTREAFCPVIAEVPLEANSDDPVQFLQSAVTYSETNLFGSLTATLLMDDETAKKPLVDEIIAKMKYGVVGVNMLPAFAYSIPQLIWGAFPGQTDSGQGILGNSGCYKRPEKAVLRAPFWWIGRELVSVHSPRKSKLIFSRMATYKLRPNFLTQAMLFSALFLSL